MNKILDKLIIESRNDSRTLSIILKELGISYYFYIKRLKELNINVKKVKGRQSNRKLINKDFFKVIDNEIKAYLLGFIYADGSINKNLTSLFISISEIDIEILEMFKENLCKESIFHNKKPDEVKRKPIKTFYICSKEIVLDLVNLGIVPNKTIHEFSFNFLEDNLKKHFIRGYFDGDGCFYKGKSRGCNKVCVNFTNSTKNVLLEIKDYFEKFNINFKLETKLSKTNTYYYVLALYNYKNLFCFGNHLYKNSNFFLQRKFQKFNNINTELNYLLKKDSQCNA